MSTIEDVDFLLSNSEQNSLTIFVDSKNRDLLQYQTPSQYVVSFDEPIRNVFGLEILDAAIPVTTYNVDNGDNVFAMTFVFPSHAVNVNDTTLYMSYLQHCDAFDTLFSGHFSANMFVCNNKAGYNNMTDVLTDGTTTYNMIIYTTVSTPGSHVIVNSNGVSYSISDGCVAACYINPHVNSSFYFSATTVYYFEWKYCIDASAINCIASLESLTYNNFDFVLCNVYQTVANANYASDELLQEMNNIFAVPNIFIYTRYPDGIFQMGYSDTSTGANSKTMVYTYLFNKGDPFILDMRKSTMRSTLGFSMYAQQGDSRYTALTYRDNNQLFMSFGPSATSQFLCTPGIVNLESARFIILRCPEIENQMLGSYGNFAYAPGVALFKMTDTNSMQQLRFDFVNILRRPFHPIGKLARLSLRFENQDGSLYDFKGVDHQILMSIKYYSPKCITRIPQSRLNPHYNPNILEYQLYKPKERKKEYNIDDIIFEQKRFA